MSTSQCAVYQVKETPEYRDVRFRSYEKLRSEGVRVGMFRPITIWPFPEKQIKELSKKVKRILVVEHNYGQLVREVERCADEACKIDFLGRINGTVIPPTEVYDAVKEEA